MRLSQLRSFIASLDDLVDEDPDVEVFIDDEPIEFQTAIVEVSYVVPGVCPPMESVGVAEKVTVIMEALPRRGS